VAGSSVPSDANLAQLLLAASGTIEAALFRGNKYTPTDLANLTGSSVVYLQKLTADLVVADLLSRRNPGTDSLPLACKQALRALEALEDGVWIFGIQERANAGDRIRIWNVSSGQQTAIYNPLSARTSRLLGDTTVDNSTWPNGS